jgi:hypothetical protein
MPNPWVKTPPPYFRISRNVNQTESLETTLSLPQMVSELPPVELPQVAKRAVEFPRTWRLISHFFMISSPDKESMLEKFKFFDDVY